VRKPSVTVIRWTAALFLAALTLVPASPALANATDSIIPVRIDGATVIQYN